MVQAVDIEIQAKEIMYHKANLNGIMAEYTGQPIDKVCHPSHQLSCTFSRLALLLHAPCACTPRTDVVAERLSHVRWHPYAGIMTQSWSTPIPQTNRHLGLCPGVDSS